MTQDELFDLHAETFKRALDIMRKKNQDYGSGGDPFSNFRSAEAIGLHPVKGILLRMMDKVARVGNFVDKGELQNESVEDALLDIINYVVLAHGMLREGAPKNGALDWAGQKITISNSALPVAEPFVTAFSPTYRNPTLT